MAIISFIRNWPPVGNQFSADQLERWMKQAGFARGRDTTSSPIST